MIKHEPQRKLRNSVYYNEDTKRMIERKSEELQLSQKKLQNFVCNGIYQKCRYRFNRTLTWS